MPADRAPSVLITGIHSDLGFAVSHQFRREGWFVIGCDHGTTTGRNARVHISADLTQESDCARAAARHRCQSFWPVPQPSGSLHAGRWRAQASFWETIAKTCAKSPAVFCYDLMK